MQMMLGLNIEQKFELMALLSWYRPSAVQLASQVRGRQAPVLRSRMESSEQENSVSITSLVPTY